MHDPGDESYHPHNCVVLPEKDVLDIEIIGTNRRARFRRWWHDLFLLSYSCDTMEGFYASYNSLRMDRFKHFHKYRHRIHPMSKFRDFWDWFILHVFIMNKILLKFTSSFLYDDLPMYVFYCGAFFELIIFTDLYVNMKTGFINKITRQVVLDTRKSLVNYCSKKLFFHVASAIPIHWLLFLRYGHNIACGLCKSNRFTCILRIVSVITLIRIVETSSYWCRKQNSVFYKYLFRFIRISTLAGTAVIQLYEILDATILLLSIEDGSIPISIMYVKVLHKYVFWNETMPNLNFFSLEMSHMFKSSINYPYPLMHFDTMTLDIISALISYVLALVVYAWCVIECYGLVNALMYSSDQNIKLKRKAMNFLEINQLPDSVYERVDDYYNYKATLVRVTETTNGLYRSLPEMLKNEIKQNCYLNILMRLPLFTQWPVPVLQQLVVMLERKVYLKNDMVAIAMMKGEGLMIVYGGILAVYSKLLKETGHLIDGDYFGALSLVTDSEVCSSYVVAVSDCTILTLNKIDFRMFMQDHPQLFESFKMDILMDKSRKERPISFDAAAGSSVTALL